MTAWLAVERGQAATEKLTFDTTPRYIRNGRDMAAWVHTDFSYQGVLNAAMILNSLGASFLADSNPYKTAIRQAGFVNFGGPAVLDIVARVSSTALKACWAEKWLVHRRLRPELFGARIHAQATNQAKYPIHADVFNSPVLSMVDSKFGTYLLPQAYPEGSPAHPSYPAGHAVLMGAGVTVLKALFNQSAVIPSPVDSSSDGLSLVPYNGAPLTVGDELNKFAYNVAIGRNTAGIHYRSDGHDGIVLGEAVALGVLYDMAQCMHQSFPGFQVTKFDGTQVLIGRGTVL
jgi:membrane-associated phospholipid phosphatase